MKKVLLASLVGSLLSISAFADHHEKKMTKEDRAKAAEKHEKMAACLRSDKSMKECHEQMHTSCAKAEGHTCKMKHGEDHGDKHDNKD